MSKKREEANEFRSEKQMTIGTCPAVFDIVLSNLSSPSRFFEIDPKLIQWMREGSMKKSRRKGRQLPLVRSQLRDCDCASASMISSIYWSFQIAAVDKKIQKKKSFQLSRLLRNPIWMTFFYKRTLSHYHTYTAT